jgi:hypothetical protein
VIMAMTTWTSTVSVNSEKARAHMKGATRPTASRTRITFGCDSGEWGTSVVAYSATSTSVATAMASAVMPWPAGSAGAGTGRPR